MVAADDELLADGGGDEACGCFPKHSVDGVGTFTTALAFGLRLNE